MAHNSANLKKDFLINFFTLKSSKKVPLTRAFIIKKSMTSKMVLFLFCQKWRSSPYTCKFGSNLMTDEWRSYRRLQRLNRFRHLAVNHGLHFVDPTDPAVHTQTIENKNGQLKDMIRRRHGVVDQILPSLLKEFNWRERFGQRNMVFYNFWSQVAALYPCQR